MSSPTALISEPQQLGNLQLTSGRTTSSMYLNQSCNFFFFFFANVSSRVNDSTGIILMGIGAAYAGVVWLLSNEGMKSEPGTKYRKC